jgi:[ribosomal protein S18]-alanine N-acetyltransferase
MPIFRNLPTIRTATTQDHTNLARFINRQNMVHRHMDWRTPLEWLGKRPFIIAEQSGLIQAALACPPDPEDLAWIRLFTATSELSTQYFFQTLIDAARGELGALPQCEIAAIGIQTWFSRCLETYGFIHQQNIVVLEWAGLLPDARPISREVMIRPMIPDDLLEVTRVDNASFEPLWRNSLESLTLAYNQSAWSTVAETDDGIIGYQISTSIPLSGHLARLAVLPDAQRKSIGYSLVYDLLMHFKSESAWRVTVNTQDTNTASLSLYERLGFRRTGEIFPVYRLDVK